MAEEEKEPEMQIGLPTDVKHVAHIGWDGPSVEHPGWVIIYCLLFYVNFIAFTHDHMFFVISGSFCFLSFFYI